MYGDKMQSMVPQYLDASMTAFRKNQQDVRSAFEGALGANPLAELTRRNMEMFQQAAGAFIPGAGGSKAKDAEIAALKAEIAELKARSEEHTSELQSLMRNKYAVSCLKKKKKQVRQVTAAILTKR